MTDDHLGQTDRNVAWEVLWMEELHFSDKTWDLPIKTGTGKYREYTHHRTIVVREYTSDLLWSVVGFTGDKFWMRSEYQVTGPYNKQQKLWNL